MLALSGCLGGRVSKALVEHRPADAEADLDRLAQIFGRDNTYVELQNGHVDIQQPLLESLPALAAKRGLPVVATGDVHYLDAADAYAHEALLCIQSGDSLKNPNHWKFESNEFYFKSPAEMALDFPGHEEAMRRTLEIAERCNVEIELGRILLPKFPLPRDATRSTTSSSSARRGSRAATDLHARAGRAAALRAEDDPRDGVRGLLPHRLRLHRLRPTGRRLRRPGPRKRRRLARRVLPRITDIDPMRYGLLFERFLNPARKDMPDMDIDFAVEGRERVINYVAEKYGRDRVAQIITFSTMAARAAVRDAGRVLEIPYGVVDRIAKLIPEGPGQTLEAR